MTAQILKEPVTEPAIDPDQPIIDAHHHLWAVPPTAIFPPYEAAALRQDIATCGHNVTATVYIDSHVNYYTDGPEWLRYAGETAATEAIAETQLREDPAGPKLCTGIIGHADLRAPQVKELLEAHAAASPGRFKGIRQRVSNDPDNPFNEPPGLMQDADFRAGLACLGAMGLSYDTTLSHPQIPQMTELARAFPDVSIVLDHVGGLMMAGRFAGRQAEVFTDWSRDMAELATCPNVTVKIGGMNLAHTGLSFVGRDHLPTSEEVAQRQGDFARRAIDLFGPDRCMFESNFPVDMLGIGYGVVWNAFKRMAAPYSAAERQALFFGTANRVYRLGLG